MFICLGLALAVNALFLMYGGDIVTTHHHTLSLLDCVFSGHIRDFYKVTVENPYGGWPANDSVSFYILFGIWDLPAWLLIRFAGVDEMAIGIMLWLKLFIVLLSCGCGFGFIASQKSLAR